jgi:Glyoxalase-like domain
MLRLMTARLTEIVVDCRDPLALARFWVSVLGYQVVRAETARSRLPPGSSSHRIWLAECGRLL